jgi:hypothetical protein
MTPFQRRRGTGALQLGVRSNPTAQRHSSVAAVILLTVMASLAAPRESRCDTPLTVLSYNVRGLPGLVARDSPRSRAKAIGSLARSYDVALFQETFEYQSVLRKRMAGRVEFTGNGAVFDARRFAGQILLAPIALAVPHFSARYGSGLSTYVKSDLTLPSSVGRAPYRVCDGWFGNNFDCWASKGYLRVRIQVPEGGAIDVYSTHLDAGRTRRAIKIRRRQLDILADAIEKNSGDRAVILGGDLNLASDQPRDHRLLLEFRERLGLLDSGAGPQFPLWNSRDYILYRSGSGAQLDIEQAGEAFEFIAATRALSDHPAVYARFRVRAMPDNAGLPSDLEGAGPAAPLQ